MADLLCFEDFDRNLNKLKTLAVPSPAIFNKRETLAEKYGGGVTDGYATPAIATSSGIASTVRFNCPQAA